MTTLCLPVHKMRVSFSSLLPSEFGGRWGSSSFRLRLLPAGSSVVSRVPWVWGDPGAVMRVGAADRAGGASEWCVGATPRRLVGSVLALPFNQLCDCRQVP